MIKDLDHITFSIVSFTFFSKQLVLSVDLCRIILWAGCHCRNAKKTEKDLQILTERLNTKS